MESEAQWEELKGVLLGEGHSPDRVDKLESYLRKDDILPHLERALSRLKKLEETARLLESEISGTGEDVMNRADLLLQSIKRLISSMIEDPSYMRPFLRDKSKIREAKNIIEVTLEEIASMERELLGRVNLYIREKGVDAEALKSYEEIPAFISLIRILRKSGAREVAEAEVEERKEDVKAGQLEEERRKEEALRSLKEAFSSLRSINEELELMGVTYVRLSHVLELETTLTEKLAGMDEELAQKHVQGIVSKLSSIESESRRLIQVIQRMMESKASVEEMKGELLERMSGMASLSSVKDVIPYIGLDFPKIPLLVRSRLQIDLLRREAERIGRIGSLLSKVLEELDYVPKDAKIDLSRLSFESAESLLESMINCLRTSRLSYGMPEAMAYTGLISEILELYPRWREKIISMLRERGEISLEDLRFIPQGWRSWVLRNLAEEGIVMVEEGRVTMRVVSEDIRRVEMEIEVIEDMVNDLGGLLPGIDAQEVRGLREDLKRAKSLFMAGRISEYRELISSLRARVGEIKMQLGVKR
ncbi:MAG: hypothetical protein BA066_07035 [Candidatus Korarchaeota archaeon NZ13-K]|nr:MAG: hypothetical protein BA066_07035 [Candidatus Korarchaeota archaeon NZ13-K]